MILMMSKYRVFCTVVELGSFTQAANKLNYSQSAVSQTIKALEQELGTTLVSRQTHRLQLTRDGESYLPFLQEIAAAEARLERRKEELSQMQNSEIRLGTFTSISRTYLPPRIQAFSARYPGVHFSMRQGEYDEIAQWLSDGRIDLGFTNLDADQPQKALIRRPDGRGPSQNAQSGAQGRNPAAGLDTRAVSDARRGRFQRRPAGV